MRPDRASHPKRPRAFRKPDDYEQPVAEEASFNAKPMIEEAAFFIAERRGFVPGMELSDWLQAERMVEDSLRAGSIAERQFAAANSSKTV